MGFVPSYALRSVLYQLCLPYLTLALAPLARAPSSFNTEQSQHFWAVSGLICWTLYKPSSAFVPSQLFLSASIQGEPLTVAFSPSPSRCYRAHRPSSPSYDLIPRTQGPSHLALFLKKYFYTVLKNLPKVSIPSSHAAWLSPSSSSLCLQLI